MAEVEQDYISSSVVELLMLTAWSIVYAMNSPDNLLLLNEGLSLAYEL